jgi:hypothetical protein
MYTFVISSLFVEHPIVDIAQFDAHEFAIVIFDEKQQSNFLNAGRFNLEQYCKCLLHKLFTLPKSKIKPFLQYQCDNLSEPIIWLNKLEKLIDLNRELFTIKEQKIKFEKALMIIELLRDSIEQGVAPQRNTFDFVKVKAKLKTYETIEEKLSCLYEVQAEYKQNKPRVLDPTEIPFDEKCTIEIEKIEKLEHLKKRMPVNTLLAAPKHSPIEKIPIRGHINILVDAFYQMMFEKQADGLPYLDISTAKITAFIADNFVDKDGHPLSSSTIRTILSPNKPEKRPKQENRIKL